MRFRQFPVKKSDFFRLHLLFESFFGQFLNFEGVRWHSKCDLGNFHSKKEFSDFRQFLRFFGGFFFFESFWPIFFDQFFLSRPPPHPSKPLIPHGSPIVVFYKKSEKVYRKNRISDADSHKPIPYS